MKRFSIIAVILICSTLINAQQNAGIGTTNPDSTAILDLTSTKQGLLPPRLSLAQRDAIQVPATGLLIFNTSSNCVNYFDGSQWVELCERSGTGGTGTGDCCSNVSGMPTKLSQVLYPTINFGSCLEYCDTLSEGGFNDWVVPTFDELTFSISGGNMIPDARIGNFVWSRTYWNTNALVFQVINESTGVARSVDGSSSGNVGCRCVRY